MAKEEAKELLAFIEKSPSCFHVIQNLKEELDKEGFIEVYEGEPWELCENGRYYVLRNASSLIAFKVPSKAFQGFHIISSHSDSPSFKIKENPEMEVEQQYVKINVEKYGQMLFAPWFDRPLSVAGRILLKEENQIYTKLVNVDRDLMLIPNLAIHVNRKVNEGYAYNAQEDMLPLFGSSAAKGTFMKTLADSAKVQKESIVGSDLFLYNRMKGALWGADEEYISSTKLDDLQCAFTTFKGFLLGGHPQNVSVYCVLDNEEVGSATKQGAASTFLKDTLIRIGRAMGKDETEHLMALSTSFMISADNAHGVHPNHAAKTDPTNRPFLNQGIVIKYSANQKYTTDGVTAAIFKLICEEAKVPYQSYVNRSDMEGGSTLGNISNTQVALNTVDIGLAQLAMHSPYETAGVLDAFYLKEAAKTFYNSNISAMPGGGYTIITRK